jgi:hypothetical protein
MAITWTLTIDCAHPGALARFWAVALGYVERPAPEGFESWHAWFAHYEVPEEEWDEGAYLCDPDGVGPNLSFMQVPESKVVKNRLHLDVQVGGGRNTPWEERWPLVLAAVERLTAAGATVLREDDLLGKPDHVMLADPEGNEFCVL